MIFFLIPAVDAIFGYENQGYFRSKNADNKSVYAKIVGAFGEDKRYNMAIKKLNAALFDLELTVKELDAENKKSCPQKGNGSDSTKRLVDNNEECNVRDAKLTTRKETLDALKKAFHISGGQAAIVNDHPPSDSS
jgi:hypothetical protein